MSDAAPKTIAVSKALDELMRNDRGRLLAGLISRLGDFQLAEDALQEALISALGHWGRSGIPHSPTGWLLKVALNKGIDRIRSGVREDRKSKDLSHVTSDHTIMTEPEQIPDERLRLIFACCHPGLEEKSRIALTLRTVCNLTTREIANNFLDTEVALGQRISRAKSKIKAKGIGFSIPEPEHWEVRLNTVLSTIYLIFTTGYVTEDSGSRDLCEEALFLLQLLNQLRPGDPEIEGALALVLLTQARKEARVANNGASVPLVNQNRQLWKKELIEQGQQFISIAVSRRHPGPFQIKAAIADCHMAEPTPDWQQMSLLYQSLWRHEPTPVVALNWAVVQAELGQKELALKKLNELQDELSEFQPWHAARAHVLYELGHLKDARIAYQEAINRAQNSASLAFLNAKLQQLESDCGN